MAFDTPSEPYSGKVANARAELLRKINDEYANVQKPLDEAKKLLTETSDSLQAKFRELKSVAASLLPVIQNELPEARCSPNSIRNVLLTQRDSLALRKRTVASERLCEVLGLGDGLVAELEKAARDADDERHRTEQAAASRQQLYTQLQGLAVANRQQIAQDIDELHQRRWAYYAAVPEQRSPFFTAYLLKEGFPSVRPHGDSFAQAPSIADSWKQIDWRALHVAVAAVEGWTGETPIFRTWLSVVTSGIDQPIVFVKDADDFDAQGCLVSFLMQLVSWDPDLFRIFRLSPPGSTTFEFANFLHREGVEIIDFLGDDSLQKGLDAVNLHMEGLQKRTVELGRMSESELRKNKYTVVLCDYGIPPVPPDDNPYAGKGRQEVLQRFKLLVENARKNRGLIPLFFFSDGASFGVFKDYLAQQGLGAFEISKAVIATQSTRVNATMLSDVEVRTYSLPASGLSQTAAEACFSDARQSLRSRDVFDARFPGGNRLRQLVARAIGRISVPIGWTEENLPLAIPFDAQRAHATVYGQTGSGKTIFLKSFISALCGIYSPHEANLWIMDFKNEGDLVLAPETFAHTALAYEAPGEMLGTDYVVQVAALFDELVMMRKQRGRFNFEEPTCPRQFVIIDEAGMLDKSTFGLQKLGEQLRLARSSGIHFILATQQPLAFQAAKTISDQARCKIGIGRDFDSQIRSEFRPGVTDADEAKWLDRVPRRPDDRRKLLSVCMDWDEGHREAKLSLPFLISGANRVGFASWADETKGTEQNRPDISAYRRSGVST